MDINENLSVFWTQKVDSSSSVRDPLGLWDHLNIQVDYVPGITSVTNRIRYYTLLAWYYENLFDDKIINHTDFERLFILTCLSHHDGDYSYSGLKHVFNIQKFKDNWSEFSQFELNFDINGFARTYYNKQISNLRCCWIDSLNQVHKTRINSDLASCLPDVELSFFKNKNFTREIILDNLSDFCMCNKNSKEIDLMSKILFGFIKHNGEWEIDNKGFTDFINKGDIDFPFQGIKIDTEEFEHLSIDKFWEISQRRRSTLFMFLKIIHDFQPKSNDFFKAIYDALYFRKNLTTGDEIDFGPVSKVADYWELLQLNVYYVYSIECILDIIQKIVRNDNGINKNDVFSSCNLIEILKNIEKRTGLKIKEGITIGELESAIENKNGGKNKFSDDLNESVLYDSISSSDDFEVILCDILIILILLRWRYSTISVDVKKSARIQKKVDIEDNLFIENLFEFINHNRGLDVLSFLNFLFHWVLRRHLFESAARFNDNNTRNWLFVEENSRLFFARDRLINIRTRDNRWYSILSLMKDIELVEGDSEYKLSDKGLLWLTKAELI